MNFNLIKFKSIITNFLLICTVLELLFFFSVINLFASCVLLFGWLILKKFVLTINNMRFYPVSFLMLMGLGIFHFVLPMPLTLVELKPVTFNMNVPFLTFTHHFLFLLVIVITHLIYTNFKKRSNFFRSILLHTNFYKAPSNTVIWITAILGLISSFYIYFIYGSWQKEFSDRSLTYYIASLFPPFIWMPLIILFTKFRQDNGTIRKSSIRNIFIYSLLVLIIGITSNMRTLLFSGVMILIFLFLIGILFGYYKLNKFINPKNLIVSVTLLFLVSGPLIDLGYAMVVVRQERYGLTASEFLKKTIDAYQDKETLEKIKNLDLSSTNKQSFLTKNWDETYINNILLNRFSNLKISDNCLYYADKIGYENPKMQDELVNQIFAFTPNILLKLFEVDYSQKLSTASYSLTDYLYSLAIGDASVKGSFVIGSMPGLGMSIFGYWYLLIVIPMFLIIFSMFDSFIAIKEGKIIFSYYFFIMVLMIVNYFNDRHVYTFEIRYILRTYFESIIIFLIIMRIIRGLSSFMSKTRG